MAVLSLEHMVALDIKDAFLDGELEKDNYM
jgi:hypothetical protein